MNLILTILIIFNALAFLFYGFNCIFSLKMQDEFTRFGLTNVQRKLTGVLQVIGGSGLLLGFLVPILGLISSLGLTLLMILGFAVRIKIKDSFVQAAPSFIFIILNGYISYKIAQSLSIIT